MLNIKFAVLTIFMGAVKTDVPYLTKLIEYKLTYTGVLMIISLCSLFCI